MFSLGYWYSKSYNRSEWVLIASHQDWFVQVNGLAVNSIDEFCVQCGSQSLQGIEETDGSRKWKPSSFSFLVLARSLPPLWLPLRCLPNSLKTTSFHIAQVTHEDPSHVGPELQETRGNRLSISVRGTATWMESLGRKGKERKGILRCNSSVITPSIPGRHRRYQMNENNDIKVKLGGGAKKAQSNRRMLSSYKDMSYGYRTQKMPGMDQELLVTKAGKNSYLTRRRSACCKQDTTQYPASSFQEMQEALSGFQKPINYWGSFAALTMECWKQPPKCTWDKNKG